MDDNSTTGSIFSKLRERLRKIRIARLKKKIKKDDETKEFINETIKNIKRVVEKDNSKTFTINRKRKYKKAISPIPQKKKSLATSEKKITDKQSTKENEIEQNNNSKPKPQKTNEKDFVDNVITRIKETRKDREYIRKKGVASSKNKDKTTNVEEKNDIQKNSLEKEKAKDELRTKIIYKIKKEFNRSIDEIEILEAKLYDLREQNNEELELEKAEKIKEEINETIKKINEIIEKIRPFLISDGGDVEFVKFEIIPKISSALYSVLFITEFIIPLIVFNFNVCSLLILFEYFSFLTTSFNINSTKSFNDELILLSIFLAEYSEYKSFTSSFSKPNKFEISLAEYFLLLITLSITLSINFKLLTVSAFMLPFNSLSSLCCKIKSTKFIGVIFNLVVCKLYNVYIIFVWLVSIPTKFDNSLYEYSLLFSVLFIILYAICSLLRFSLFILLDICSLLLLSRINLTNWYGVCFQFLVFPLV